MIPTIFRRVILMSFETIKKVVKSQTFCWQLYSCHDLYLCYLSFPHLWCPCLVFKLFLISNTIIYSKKAITIISFSEPKSHFEPVFKYLSLLKVNHVIESQILSIVYKWSCRLLTSYFSEYCNDLILLFINIQLGNHVIEIFM